MPANKKHNVQLNAIQINEYPITQVSHTKFLCVYIDEHLKCSIR